MDRDFITKDERDWLDVPRETTPRESIETVASRPHDSGSDEPLGDGLLLELHERFAGRLGDFTSHYVRHSTQVKLQDERLGTYSEFILQQSLPTCCAHLASTADRLELFCCSDPTIVLGLIDGFMGTGTPTMEVTRPLSEIEDALAKVIFAEIANHYMDLWSPSVQVEMVTERISHNAQQWQSLPGNAPCYLSRYQIAVGRQVGRMIVCLPWETSPSLRMRRTRQQLTQPN